MEKTINAVKNGYLNFIDWRVAHPHQALWLDAAVVVGVMLI